MDVLEEVIVEFHKLGLPEVERRELKLPINLNKTITVIGLRRVGKTYRASLRKPRSSERG